MWLMYCTRSPRGVSCLCLKRNRYWWIESSCTAAVCGEANMIDSLEKASVNPPVPLPVVLRKRSEGPPELICRVPTCLVVNPSIYSVRNTFSFSDQRCYLWLDFCIWGCTHKRETCKKCSIHFRCCLVLTKTWWNTSKYCIQNHGEYLNFASFDWSTMGSSKISKKNVFLHRILCMHSECQCHNLFLPAHV